VVGRPGWCTRSSTASTPGTALCIPNETRVTPWARSSPSTAWSTLSGLASVVTSARGANPNSASMARRIWPNAAGGIKVGVPPPKNTVLTGTSAASTLRAKAISASASSG
jgi:hypothetical protein